VGKACTANDLSTIFLPFVSLLQPKHVQVSNQSCKGLDTQEHFGEHKRHLWGNISTISQHSYAQGFQCTFQLRRALFLELAFTEQSRRQEAEGLREW